MATRARNGCPLSLMLCTASTPQTITSNNNKESVTMSSFPTKVSTGEREGNLTSTIESQTSKIPSGGYLTAAIVSMIGSATLRLMGKDNWALFVGQWAPTFLVLGVYNKMVKQHGSDAFSRAA